MEYEYDFDKAVDSPEDPLPGIYCAWVYLVNDTGVTSKGNELKGIEVSFSITAGDPEGMEKRVFRDVFWHPDPQDPEKAGRDLARIKRIWTVCTGAPPEGKKKVNWQSLKGTFLVIKIENYTNDKGKTKLVVADYGRGYYSLNDPAVSEVPKAYPGNFTPPKGPKKPAAPPKSQLDKDAEDVF